LLNCRARCPKARQVNPGLTENVNQTSQQIVY
jgi:hypothetical protein